MSIQVACSCGQDLRVKDHLGGKKVRCPQCGQPLKIPRPRPDTMASGPTRRPGQPTPTRKRRSASGRKGSRLVIIALGGLLTLGAVAALWLFALRPKPDTNGSPGEVVTPLVSTPTSLPSPPAPADPPAPAGPATASFPVSRPETGPAFDLAAWVKAVAQVGHDAWNKRHPGPYNGSAGFGWYDDNDDTSAQRYIITWGPLGIRTRMHDHTWGRFAAFRHAWPAGLLDASGELLLDCFEVVDVIPGSPADGHLRKGDLLVAMDGQRFTTAGALRPDQPRWQHQFTRGLEIDAGERLDLAEGRGRIAFDVLRLPDGQKTPPATAALVRDAQVSGEIRQDALREVELDVPVKTAEELTLLLELTRKHNGSCAADLIRPRLEGPAGSLDLSAVSRLSEANGWRSLRRKVDNDDRDIQYKGKAVAESLWIHAPCHLTWTIPPGYDRFRATVVCRSPAEGYRARVRVRSAASLPPAFQAHHQVVAFDIPRIGSYGKGAPNHDDAKSALVARMIAAWLADQQQPDGSWKRTAGYTHNGYDTAWAGLGLLAQADPKYEAHIRKAADYLAFRCPQDGWAIPNSLMVMFLSEYWLRTHDDRILTALQSQVERLRSEMVYGDYVSGHGHVPGYRGTGVSTGGSHIALAFTLANQTPVKVESRLVDRMLARAQELAPDGFIPYGRSSGTRTFEPNLASGGTYSGRHGPYLVASYIHGGPRLFTENCSAIYSRGDIGGMDQGHATQSLTTTWGLLAAAAVSPEALERHFAALRWKLTMLRTHDGGFCQNPYRLEYQGGEGLLPTYLRSGAYLVILNSQKHNLAITGAPQWRARTFLDLPPVCHEDAVALGYYQRNWGVAAAMLADKAPPPLQAGLAKLLAMGKSNNTRAELYGFLKTEAAPTARAMLALTDVDSTLKQYLAEMVLGVDLRLTVTREEKDGKESKADGGRWKVALDAQHPLAGFFEGATNPERAAWRQNPPLAMTGSVEVHTAKPIVFTMAKDCGNGGWQTTHQEQVVDGPAKGPLELKAHLRFQVADLTFDYERPIIGDGESALLGVDSGEKGRSILGDRIIWVTGRLYRDLGGWSVSFLLPSGQYISAATQGVGVNVTQGANRWIAPMEGGLPAGTQCQFGFTSGFQYFEARVSAIKLPEPLPEVSPRDVTVAGKAIDRKKVADRNRTTGQVVPFPAAAETPLVVDVELPAVAPVRGIDLRLKDNGRGLRLAVEVQVKDAWQVVFQGRPGDRLSTFPLIDTQRLRVKLIRQEGTVRSVELQELHVIGKAP